MGFLWFLLLRLLFSCMEIAVASLQPFLMLMYCEELTQSGNFVRVKLSFGLPKVEERIFKLSTLPLVFNQDAFGKLRLKLKNGSTLWFDDNGNCWLGVDVGDTVRYDGKSIVRALRFKSDVFWRDEPYLELL